MAKKDFTVQAGNTTPKPKTRRKSETNRKVVANILHITPERRKAFADHEWREATKVFILSLTDNELNICRKAMQFALSKPENKGTPYDCKVIAFPIHNKNTLSSEGSKQSGLVK